MSMQTRQKTLVIAAVLGVLAAALVWSFLAGQKAQKAESEVQVVVAASNIPRETVVSPADITMRSYAKELVPAGAAISEGMVVGKVTTTDIRADQPILTASLMSKDRLSYVIPPFMRAVTVGLDPVIGVGGFLKPGDRVDVIATFDMNETSFAKTVLQNVSLLAIGSEAVEEGDKLAGDKQTARVQPTATLAVTPTEAERLILAEAKGRLRLTLRSAEDRLVKSARPISVSAVMGVAPTKSARASAPAAAPTGGGSPLIPPAPVGGQQLTPLPGTVQIAPPVKTVTVVRGTKVEETVVPE
ncbi:MAG: Flp pilus assembly protein CpaB [Armatimonadetes bacterium]|nr:Flp pilus assembly protein CpaB [Armatimonadota bacterium]